MVKVLLAASFLLSVSCSQPSRTNAPPKAPPDARVLGDRATKLLAQGDARAVVSLMHYPPTFTPEERQRDMAAGEASIQSILQELGEISHARAHEGVAAFYDVGGSGGTVPYLPSLSPEFVKDVVYEATYSKQGPGYVHLRIMRLNSKTPLEILGVYFGLPESDPRSKPAMLAIARKEMASAGMQVTPDIERQLEQSLQPVRI